MILQVVNALAISKKKSGGKLLKLIFATKDDADFFQNVVSQVKIQPEEWSMVAMLVYRFGRFIHYHSKNSIRKKFWVKVYRYYFINYMLGRLGLNIYYTVSIGFGTKIYHPFGIVINSKSIIGKNVKLRQGITIGNKGNNKLPSPKIGDNVDIGSGAIVIGNISIGDYSKIGAGSVVTKDCPKNSVMVGNPAKNIKNNI